MAVDAASGQTYGNDNNSIMLALNTSDKINSDDFNEKMHKRGENILNLFSTMKEDSILKKSELGYAYAGRCGEFRINNNELLRNNNTKSSTRNLEDFVKAVEDKGTGEKAEREKIALLNLQAANSKREENGEYFDDIYSLVEYDSKITDMFANLEMSGKYDKNNPAHRRLKAMATEAYVERMIQQNKNRMI